MTESKPQWEISAIKSNFLQIILLNCPQLCLLEFAIICRIFNRFSNFYNACLQIIFELVSLINSTSSLFIGPRPVIYCSFVRISYSAVVGTLEISLSQISTSSIQKLMDPCVMVMQGKQSCGKCVFLVYTNLMTRIEMYIGQVVKMVEITKEGLRLDFLLPSKSSSYKSRPEHCTVYKCEKISTQVGV